MQKLLTNMAVQAHSLAFAIGIAAGADTTTDANNLLFALAHTTLLATTTIAWLDELCCFVRK